MKSLIPLLFSAVFLTAAPAAAQDNCGATGDGCQPPEYQKLLEIAATAFPDWPEVGYRTYAALCYEAKGQLRKQCFANPKKAAKSLKLPPEE
ncbi:hypothetical protein GCM10011491_41230 [Brucella endophytica]|uniref:Uncharacterized protein n=2 Tax=Brucella endophytica TaxID=1963359 RepID=A0A916SNK6_9HYPH|nr:hypothetical protein [Brucella endophytica]GGB09030.1 hypothetical protein GCM10011491_41230 [Brucella endophytica]